MITNTLSLLFDLNLKKLISEIELYKNEDDIWRIEKNISNSAGNLVLHIIGNLNTYIGKEIAKNNYVRNRELEFSTKNIPRKDLIESITEIRQVINKSLKTLTHKDLKREYPLLVLSEMTTTEYLLVHLATHLSYHLGQINYHRRFI
ncbi:DUF1572 family protein [Flavobacterium sp. 102]|uniref:DUF1572 family protein n=1 Tax=Flavobacterium sp. 102 TaxID=2135623 RepID=UPI000EB0BC03|nr:DUF1572 family protein [Flavobacterium sp. 102]RKS03130.1 uncharacterized protein DUF1572 [Flavobacterium sp. 102]